MWHDDGGQRGSAPFRLLLGLLVIALGVIFLGSNLGWFDGKEVLHRFWPVAFVVIGVTILLQPRDGGSSRLWGLIWIGAGAWIYAQHERWIRVGFWDVFLPLAIVLVGGTLVWRALGGGGRRRGAVSRWRGHGEIGDDYVRSLGFMSGNVLRSTSTAFRGADLAAFMGGVTLDLTNAKMDRDEAVVDVLAFWGGIEVRVPPEWSVTSRVMPVMAGYEDKTRPSGTTSGKRLVMRGVVVMGGVEVKS